MSVALAGDAIRLTGNCPVEDAETLLALLQENAVASIDINDCGCLHMAVVQVLLAAARPVRGAPANAFVREWLVPQMLSLTD
ncbi:hypothetical protein [Sphingomonas soli]|uniref:hypothetical protein n=1 Tax=Sphingomonas soli TaxID=266127 RepID=UPI00082B4D7F|nr:hypothetical protein [Sphingomonas soli]